MDIRRFCCAAGEGGNGRAPSRHAGFVYATNGRVALRVPEHRVADADSIQCDGHSRLIDLFERFDARSYTWYPLPPLKPRDARRCATCEGAGRVTSCTDCDGEGEFEHGMHTYGCKHCNESGVLPVHDPDEPARSCPECSGSGFDGMTGVPVGESFYALRHLQLIADEYPDAEIGVPSGDPGEMAAWRGPQVIGALMPLPV